MSKRKHRRKKQISADEKERRKQLAEKRKERQKREKRQSTIELIVITLLGIIFLAVILLSAIFCEELLLIFFIVTSVAMIILFDQSGIRSIIFSWYPDKFIFVDYLKNYDAERAVPMQLASTTGWIMFMLIILEVRYRTIWALIWLISIITGLYYMLTDERYSLEKGAKYECTMLYLFVTPIFITLMLMYNIRLNKFFIAFIVIFALIYSIAYAVRVNNGNRKYSRIIYGLIVSVFCASSGFLLINRTLDFSEPQEHTLIVEDKDYSGGKNTTYYIYTRDWENPEELIDIKVNSDTYHELEIGDSVIIETQKGFLNMDYYEYKEKK